MYHAYIHESHPPSDSPPEEPVVQESEPGWEMLDSGEGAVGGDEAAGPGGGAVGGAVGGGAGAGAEAEVAREVMHMRCAEINSLIVFQAPSGPSVALPAGWEERQDANGRTYYVNHIARTTQWQHPGLGGDTGGGGEEGRSSEPPDSEDSEAERSERRQYNRRNHMSVDDTQRAVRNSVSEAAEGGGSSGANDGGAAEATTSRSRTTSESDVPDTGGPAGGGGSRGGGGVGGGRVSSNPSSKTTPTNLNLEGLPSGWTMQVAPNGRVFFIDHINKKTTWVDPRNSRPSPLPSQSNVPNRRHQDDLGPLPEGWEERVHTDGRIFFIDHNTRLTQWEDPRISNPQIAGQAVPYSRDYKRKYEYLKQQLKKPSNVPNKIEIKVASNIIIFMIMIFLYQVRRNTILEDSYRQVSKD